ncbi:cytoskeletal protein RodZ [Streptomyces sp. V4I8]
MAAMRRGLVHVLAWSLATGAAVTLSWWGVHTVMAGTVYDRPRALPITAADATTQESKPLASSTNRPTPSKGPSSPSPKPAGTPRTPTPSQTPPTSTSPSPTTSGQVKSYDTDGGRVVFDIAETDATLVSATPGAGWSMQVWKTETWIRVEFGSGADRVSVFCTWHDGPPRVEIGDY